MDEDTQCWFCWEEVTAHDRAPALGCSCKGSLTSAHKTCMKDWLVKHPESCPNCRQPYDQRVVASLVSPRASLKLGRSSGSRRPTLLAVRHASPLMRHATPDGPPETSHRRRQVLRDALEARRRAHDDQRRTSLGRPQGPQLRSSARADPADASVPIDRVSDALANVHEGVAQLQALLRATREELASTRGAPAPPSGPAHPPGAAPHLPPHPLDFGVQELLAGARRAAPSADHPPMTFLTGALPTRAQTIDFLMHSAAPGRHASPRNAPMPDAFWADLFAPAVPRPTDTLPLPAHADRPATRARATHRADAAPLFPLDDPEAALVSDADLPPPPFNSPAVHSRARSRRVPSASPRGPRLRLRAARAAVRRAAGAQPGDSSADDSDDSATGAAAGPSGAGAGASGSRADAPGASGAAAAAGRGHGRGGAEGEGEEGYPVMVSRLGRQRGAPALRPLGPRPAIRKLRVPRPEWEVIDLTADDE